VIRFFRLVFSSLALIGGLLAKALFRVCFFLFFVAVVPAIAAEQKTAQKSNPAAPAWTEYSDSQQVHSDLTVAIYDAIYAAGMSFPFPQREVRVLSDGNAAAIMAPVRVNEKKA
jgi:hypothetical protein